MNKSHTSWSTCSLLTLWVIMLLTACTLQPIEADRPHTHPGNPEISGQVDSIEPPIVDFLVPTPIPQVTPPSTPISTPQAEKVPEPVHELDKGAPELPEPYSLRWRAGVGIPDGGHPNLYTWPDTRPGWYLNWHFSALITATQHTSATIGTPTSYDEQPGVLPDYLEADTSIPDDAETGMEYVPMVYNVGVATETLESMVRQLPGRTWLIGNEPDVRWQGNLTPEVYAAGYHRAYQIIKNTDPTAQVAIGGITQVTPLRLAYLDRVREIYAANYGEPMPVDVWNIHTFILQEKRDDWGVDIPPGFDHVDEGMLWTIEDHNSIALIEEQIRIMRAWMQARGEQDKPLWITEYGILMPEAYGFDPETVAKFMVQSFDLFRTLRDPELGWAEDDYMLVQRWVWFSTGYERYPTGDLFDANGLPTLLMETYSAYLEEHGP